MHAQSSGQAGREYPPVAMPERATRVPAPGEHLALRVDGQRVPAASHLHTKSCSNREPLANSKDIERLSSELCLVQRNRPQTSLDDCVAFPSQAGVLDVSGRSALHTRQVLTAC